MEWDGTLTISQTRPARPTPNRQEYTVVRRIELHALVDAVNYMTKQHWIPLGGIAIWNDAYYQAMTRETANEGV